MRLDGATTHRRSAVNPVAYGTAKLMKTSDTHAELISDTAPYGPLVILVSYDDDGWTGRLLGSSSAVSRPKTYSKALSATCG